MLPQAEFRKKLGGLEDCLFTYGIVEYNQITWWRKSIEEKKENAESVIDRTSYHGMVPW